jgi:hypothetical protein
VVGAAGVGGIGGAAGQGGSGGEAGTGGVGGAAGSGGDCALTGEWETVGSWGDETFSYGNVFVLQDPNDGRLWHVALRTSRGGPDEFADIALFRSDDGGESWVEAQTWDFPEGRTGWNSGAAMADDGTIYVVLREFDQGSAPITNRFVKLLRRAPGGALLEAGAFRPDDSDDTRSNGIVARGDEAWFIAFNATPFPPDYHMLKYEDGVLESVDVIRYGDPANEVYVRDLAVSPGGTIWATGQGFDTPALIWHATIWEEGEGEFSLIADIQRTPGVDESDTIMALAFESDNQYWSSYYTIHDGNYRWRGGYGTVEEPETSFTLNDEFSYDETRPSITERVAVHGSGAVFMGGDAVDENGWQWAVVRKGTMGGFELSDEFIRGGDGSYKSEVTDIFVDADGNVWVAYMSRPATAWYPKSATLKMMACVLPE